MVPTAVSFHRIARRLRDRGVPVLPDVLQELVARMHHCALDLDAEIEEGVELGYSGMGVVIERGVRVERGAFLSQDVTVGALAGVVGVPRIGAKAMLGAGSKVLGPVVIGEGAVIGANAVVTCDVGPGEVVAGIPAAPIRRATRR